MKSLLIKGSLVLALAAVFGMPNATAAPLVAVEPIIAVVDGNHAAIVGANGLLNAFIQNHPNAVITEIAFDADGGQIKYEVEGVDESGKYELTYIYATNQIFEKREGDYHKSLKKTSFDPREILPPAAVVNFAYAQTQGKATSLNKWSVHHEKGKIIYKVTFGTEGNKEVDVRIDAINGTLLSVKFDN